MPADTVPTPSAPPSPEGESFRSFVVAVIEQAKRILPVLAGLVIAALVAWTNNVQNTADDAKDTAEVAQDTAKSAEVKGVRGVVVAKTTNEELAGAYAALLKKVEGLDAQAELDRKRIAALESSRTVRRRTAPVLKAATDPLPPTPAAAAAEAANP